MRKETSEIKRVLSGAAYKGHEYRPGKAPNLSSMMPEDRDRFEKELEPVASSALFATLKQIREDGGSVHFKVGSCQVISFQQEMRMITLRLPRAKQLIGNLSIDLSLDRHQRRNPTIQVIVDGNTRSIPVNVERFGTESIQLKILI